MSALLDRPDRPPRRTDPGSKPRRRAARTRAPLAGLALACAALAPRAAVPASQEHQERPQLPPSPAARAWAAAAQAVPSEAGRTAEDAFAPWPDGGDPAWDDRAPWRRWSALVRALADGGADERAADGAEEPRSRAALRASLALCALAQGRFDDAWTHFAAVGDGPALARLLPGFLPGAPAGHPALVGGVPAPLAAGVRLAPALPPETEAASSFGAREMHSAPFVVDGATLAMRVYFEPGDGVQVDLEHLGGPPAELVVRLPHPLDFALGKVYRDWDEVPEAEAAAGVAVRLSAEHPEVSLWANHVGLPPSFPRALPDELPGGFRRAGVRLAPDAAPRLRRFAEALSELCDLPLAPGPDGALPPARADSAVDRALGPLVLEPASAPHWAALVSALERFVLRQAAAGPPENAADSPSRH